MDNDAAPEDNDRERELSCAGWGLSREVTKISDRQMPVMPCYPLEARQIIVSLLFRVRTML